MSHLQSIGLSPQDFPRFIAVLTEAWSHGELRHQFDRLNGWRTNVSLQGAGIELLIDLETGRIEKDFLQFVTFVKESIWDRLNWTGKG